MGKYVMTVLTNPAPGQEDRYNEWYDNVHIHEVLKVPGFVACTRYRMRGDAVMGTAAHKYLAVYEIEAKDPEASIAALQQAVSNGMTLTDAMDMASVSSALFEPTGSRVTR